MPFLAFCLQVIMTAQHNKQLVQLASHSEPHSAGVFDTWKKVNPFLCGRKARLVSKTAWRNTQQIRWIDIQFWFHTHQELCWPCKVCRRHKKEGKIWLAPNCEICFCSLRTETSVVLAFKLIFGLTLLRVLEGSERLSPALSWSCGSPCWRKKEPRSFLWY